MSGNLARRFDAFEPDYKPHIWLTLESLDRIHYALNGHHECAGVRGAAASCTSAERYTNAGSHA